MAGLVEQIVRGLRFWEVQGGGLVILIGGDLGSPEALQTIGELRRRGHHVEGFGSVGSTRVAGDLGELVRGERRKRRRIRQG